MEITWKSFLLRTEPKATTREKFVNYSQNWQTMAEMEPRATFNPWTMDTPGEPPSSSLPAQVAAKVVEANWPHASGDLHWALLRAYFTENRTISDWAVLTDIVASVGVDPASFVEHVEAERAPATQLVIDEHNSAINQGITAVPTVLINQVLPVPGAQESDTYITWISRILERERS